MGEASPSSSQWTLPQATALALTLSAVTATVAHYALSIFNFFDMSAFMDAGYRVYIGQKIYTDFEFNAGPGHPYLHALFYALLGFNKTAILAHVSCLNTAVMLGI